MKLYGVCNNIGSKCYWRFPTGEKWCHDMRNLTMRSVASKVSNAFTGVIFALTLSACLLLTGCVVVGISSTNLRVMSAQSEQRKLLNPVVYVVHSTFDQQSWRDALSGFTNDENIVFVGTEDASQQIQTHVANTKSIHVVDIYFQAEEEEPKFADKAIFVSTMLSFLTISVIPGLMEDPYTFKASFSLSNPNEINPSPPHWEYLYRRQLFLWLPLLPIADTIGIFSSEFKNDEKWKVEEKRRLILSFLNDAEPLLRESQPLEFHNGVNK
jgi:hypothetical protein